MEKKTIKEVIVVEGKNDTSHLKKFFNVDTIETNGLGITKETIELIKFINSTRGVILMLDPDTPGEKIRRKINDKIPNLKNIYLLKQDARTKKKVGIEHATEKVLVSALENVITNKENLESISFDEYCELGLIGKKTSANKRAIVSKKFHLGKCNAKTLFKRLNMAGITKEQL